MMMPEVKRAVASPPSMIGRIVKCILGCFFRGGKGKDKKTDTTRSNDNLEQLEGGFGGGQGGGGGDNQSDGEDWDDWNKPSRPVIPAAPLQKLDDFDGMAPAKPADDKDEDQDFFSTLGPTVYVPPKKVDPASKPKASMVLGMDDDVDIDLDSWEAGNATRKGRKKGLGGTKVS